MLATAPAADVVCRPNTLGSVSCPAARPLPRPPARASVQALDRVLAEGQEPKGPQFIPARRTNRLGGITIEQGGSAGRCRPDTLGNLNCR